VFGNNVWLFALNFFINRNRFGVYNFVYPTAADGFTLLAPIDSDAFNTAVVDELLADPDALAAILKDHILDTTMYSIGLELDTPYETFGGNSIQVSFNDGTYYT
jgi:hypothetical protein